MRLIGFLLALILISRSSFGLESEAPTQFDKQPFSYILLSKVALDVDSTLKEIGIDAQACRLQSVTPVKNYPGLGTCLYHAIHATIKSKQPSTIILWVKSKGPEALPPLMIVWKHTHANWSKFVHEFLYMTFEGFFGFMLKSDYNVKSSPDSAKCRLTSVPDRDLGNFLGNLSIHIPRGRKIAEYFNIEFLQPIRTETIHLSAKVPYYLDKKRVYRAQVSYQNPEYESVDLSVTTNFNLVVPRDACLKADLMYNPKSVGVVP